MMVKRASNHRQGPRFWFVTLAIILGVGVIATFFADGRSIAAEWMLLASQLGAATVFSLPAALLIAKVSNGCIVCNDEEVCDIEGQKNVRS